MATGIVKSEKLGEDALLANTANSEPYSLPSSKDEAILNYSNKVSEYDLLKDVEHNFKKYQNTNFIKTDNIEMNSLLLADNFYGLKGLLKNFKKKVNLIYIDPPYGTGKDFQSRELKHAYKDILSTTAWIEFIRRRLLIMKELLADDGSIYVHIGHQMLFHLKLILDEVFGESNFRNMIVRKKCSSKNYTKNQYANLNDYILFYTKSKKYTWNQPSIPATKEWIEKEYPKKDENGKYKLVPIHAPGVRNGETGKPWRGMMPPKGKHWQLVPDKLEKLDNDGLIHWSKNGNPRRKVYLTEDKQLPLTDYWDNYRDAHHQSVKITGYPTEKNLDMIKKIISASSNEGDLILDAFSGSGTTIQAANELNRNWLGIDQSFTAIETTLKRLKYGSNPMGDYVHKKNMITTNTLFEESIKFNFVIDSNVFECHKEEVEKLAQIM